MTGEVVAYRHAAYDTPWWANPSSRSGRFHRAGEQTTQYLCVHPLGPAAEMLRQLVEPGDDPEDFRLNLRLNLWAVRVNAASMMRVGFGDSDRYGIPPDALVGDDHLPTQALADTIRATGAAGIIVPSAALPGTENLVLFGPRLTFDYLGEPIGDVDVPTGHVTADARPAAEVLALVRLRGAPHPSLVQWRAFGTYAPLEDPPAA